jgi:hypothetical protein
MSNRQLSARDEEKIKADLQDQFRQVYTPGTPITDPALFAGRLQFLEIVRQTRGVGMNYVIQGPAGLGKTSLARQLFRGEQAFWHTASEDTDFVSIFLAVLLSIGGAGEETERTVLKRAGVSLGSDAIGTKADFGTELNVKQVRVADQKLDLNFVLDRVVKRQTVIESIVIDEFHRIKDAKVHTQVVEVIKGLADRGANVTVALVGVAPNGEELVKDPEYSQYLGRHVTVIRLRPMTQSETLEIFERRKDFFNVAFPPTIQQMISWISCGYPYIVHKLALQSCFAWLKRSLTQIVTELVMPVALVFAGPFGGLLSMAWSTFSGRRQRNRTPDLRILSVSIQRADVVAAVQQFVDEYESNHPLAMETLQGLGQTEREQLLRGSVEEVEKGDQYFPCYVRAKDYLKSGGSTVSRRPRRRTQ